MCRKCSSCSKCGNREIGQIIDNLPYCSDCFELQYENECCPHCTKDFKDKKEVKIFTF